MRTTILAIALLLCAAGCGGISSPVDVANRQWDAYGTGDFEALADLLADNGRYLFEGEVVQGFWDEMSGDATGYGFLEFADFDGDGVTTFADMIQAQSVYVSGYLADIDYECVEVDDDSAECTGSEVPRYEGAGLPFGYRFTVSDGKIVEMDQYLSGGPDFEAAFAAHLEFVTDYTNWLASSSDGRGASLYAGGAAFPGMERDQVELNRELMDEYLTSLGY